VSLVVVAVAVGCNDDSYGNDKVPCTDPDRVVLLLLLLSCDVSRVSVYAAAAAALPP
jgi:hypothetical protein